MTITDDQFVPASIGYFSERYKQFASLADLNPDGLWCALNNAEAFNKMKWATEDMELPAVAGVVKLCLPFITAEHEERRNHLKKGIGAIVCCVMEANHFQKTGTKKAVPPVPERVFRKGEVYRPLPSDSNEDEAQHEMRD